jgi:phenylpyruvate tautomerase PptA (4-oxalocrotonate tautomerase family)
MPMCDVYIPKDALPADTERELLSRVTDLLVEHELRRVTDLVENPEGVDASRTRARSVAWLFLHRPEVYVAGAVRDAPYYKFECMVPEGQADDEFRAAVTRDITQAVTDAEGGKWPHPEARVWVFTWEVPEGTWGALGGTFRLRDVIDWVAPELTDLADGRLAARRREEARAIIEAGELEPLADAVVRT